MFRYFPAMTSSDWAAWVQAIGTILAVVAAIWISRHQAKVTRRRDEEKVTKEKRRRDLAAGNRAIFTMIRQINKLLNIQRQVIDPFRGNPAALVEMPPMEGLDAEQIEVDIDSLDFLLEGAHGDLLGEIAVAQSKYDGAISALKQRARVHMYEAQPRFERAPIAAEGHTESSMRDVVLGPRVFETLKQSTEQAVSLVDSSLVHLKATANQLTANLKETFPGDKIVSFIIPESQGSLDASATTTLQ